MKRGMLAFWGAMMLLVAAIWAWRIADRESALAPRGAADTVVVLGGDDEQEAPLVVAPFTLTAQSGQAFNSAELEGQIWVASFFFANCPGECTVLNQRIARLQEELADVPVRFVSISVDPEFDTPERLEEYAERIGADVPRWVFLTGTMDDVSQVALESFKVSVGLRTHTDRLILVDRQGRVRGRFRGTADADVEMLKRKVAEVTTEST